MVKSVTYLRAREDDRDVHERERVIKTLLRERSLVRIADACRARGSLVVCPLSRIGALITDSEAPIDALDMLRGHVVRVAVFDAGAQTNAAT
jgi:DeoR family ulaG and ulaABCDEF operon transcriptional repressor